MVQTATLNGFIPNALRRILSILNPADQVLCHIADWQFRSVACQELHKRLAVPQFGMLLLRWPLCFGLKEDIVAKNGDKYSYFKLMRDNIEASETSDGSPLLQMEIFLTGYETMMLKEIAYSMHLYAGVTTLVISLGCIDRSVIQDSNTSLYTEESFESLVECWHEPCRLSRIRRNAFKELLQLSFITWKLWAPIIASVMNECALSILHLVFDDSGAVDYTTKIPGEFYKELEFDKNLAKMQNLQTLYLPTLSRYERAFDPYKSTSTLAWKALHDLTPADRLPNLRRVVFSSVRDPHYYSLDMNGRPAATFGLPIIAARGVLVESCHDDCQRSRLNAIFPECRLFARQLLDSKAFFIRHPQELGELNEDPLIGTDYSFYRPSPYAEKFPSNRHFIQNLMQSVEIYVKNRNEAFSVYSYVHAERTCRFMPPKIEIGVEIDHKDASVNSTMKCLFGNTNAYSFDRMVRQIARPRVVLKLDVNDAQKNRFGTLLKMLPVFGMEKRAAADVLSDRATNALKFAIYLRQEDSGLGDVIRSIRNECNTDICSRLYDFPPIELEIECSIDARAHCNIWGNPDVVMDYLESEMTNRITEFLNDAYSASWTKIDCRGLMFSMYRKVARVVFHFSISPRGHTFSITPRKNFNGENRFVWFKEIFAVRQEKLQQRVWDQIFVLGGGSGFISVSDDQNGKLSVNAAVDRILPLPSLRFFELKCDFSP